MPILSFKTDSNVASVVASSLPQRVIPEREFTRTTATLRPSSQAAGGLIQKAGWQKMVSFGELKQ